MLHLDLDPHPKPTKFEWLAFGVGIVGLLLFGVSPENDFLSEITPSFAILIALQMWVRSIRQEFPVRSHLEKEIGMLGSELSELLVRHRCDGESGGQVRLIDQNAMPSA